MEEKTLAQEANLPDNWTPVGSEPIRPGVALAAPNPVSPFFSGTLAPSLQHDTMFVDTKYGSTRVPAFPVLPFAPSASAAVNSAIKSATTIKSGAGASISGLVWKGTWNSFTAYAINDVVLFNVSAYVAVKVSVNVEPDTDTTIWTLLSENFVYRGQWSQNTGSFPSLVLTLTQVTMSGTDAIYSYSSYMGQDPAIGMHVTFTNFTAGSGANNVANAVLTAVSGGATGTVTISHGAGTNEIHAGIGTGLVSRQAATLNGGTSSNSPWAKAFPVNTVAGNMLFVWAGTDQSNNATATISDTGGNTWISLQHVTGATLFTRPSTFWLWYCVAKGGASTVTVTSGVLGGFLQIVEFQGPLTLDQNLSVFVPTGNPDPQNAPTVTTTSINNLVVGAFFNEQTPTTENNGFSVATGGSGSSSITIYKSAPTMGSYTPSINVGTTGTGFIGATSSWIQGVVTNITYYPYDVVEYLGSTYVCVAQTTTIPTNTTYWVQLSQGTGYITNITGAYNAVAGDYGRLLTNTTSSNYAVTLPATPPLAAWWIALEASGTGTLTVNPNGQTLDGSSSNLVLSQNQGILIFTDGTNYYTQRGMSNSGGVNSQTISYAALLTDGGKLISMNGSSLTLTLPSPPPNTRWWIAVENKAATTLTVARNGLTIDGAASNLSVGQNQGVFIFTDGTNYFTERGIGFANPMTTLGDIIYEDATPVPVRLAGNTTTTKKFLTQTGTGAISAVPAWGTVTAADIPVGGVNSQTISYLAVAGDTGKLIAMNGSSLTLTLPALPPSALWWVSIENINTTSLTVARNGLTIDGAASNLTLNQDQGVVIFTDGSNYFTERGIGGGSSSLAVHQVSHGFSTGQAVYFTGTVWALAKANAVSTLGIGIAKVTGSDDFTAVFSGPIIGLSGLTAGQYYFVSDATSGLLTVTEPISLLSYSNPLLFAFTTTTGLVLPFRPSEIDPAQLTVVNKNVAYNAVAGDLVLCDTSGAGFTVTLPLSASNGARRIIVKKVSTDVNTLTVATSGSDTIDTSSTELITVPQTSMSVVADGTIVWEIV